MGCDLPSIKYSVFLFNAISAGLGIATIVASGLAWQNYHDDDRAICLFMILLGAIVFIISFFGCYGAIRENVCLTWTYASCLLILIIGNAILIFAYLKQIDGETKARDDINSAWLQQLKGVDAMSDFQNTFQCCGIKASADYINANLTIPNSCVIGNKEHSTILYSEGCLTKVIAKYEAAEHWLEIFTWSSFCIEIFAFTSACLLAISFSNQKRRERY